jgi:hypothetical protein
MKNPGRRKRKISKPNPKMGLRIIIKPAILPKNRINTTNIIRNPELEL